MERERRGTVMSAKYRHGDDLLRILTQEILRDESRLPGPTIVCLVCRKESAVRKAYPGCSFI